MSQKCAKKLVLLKTYYYRLKNQDGQFLTNNVYYNTNPTTATGSVSSIIRMTDKNYIPIKNEFIEYNGITIPANNPLSGITKQTTQQTIMIKTKCGFVSFNTFTGGYTSDSTTIPYLIDYQVTAASGDLKNAVKVTIEYDNDGSTSWSNGAKFARRVFVYGYACK
jgi:hypothetical protein